MAGGSIGGVVSGLDTASLIQQVMQVEGRSQALLKNRVKGHESAVTALQGINTKMQALLTAAKDLRRPDTWNSIKATSSDTSVTATAGTAAVPGSATFKVMNLARAEVQTTTTTVPSTTAVIAGSGTITVTKAVGDAVEISVGDGSLDAVAKAINARTDLGVRALSIQVEPGQFRLQLSSTKTGAAAGFTVAGFDVGYETTQLTAAADAVIQFGDSAVGQVKSATNTFENVIPGVTFTVSAADKTVTLDLVRDVEGTADKAKALVDAANAALEEIRKQSAFDPLTKKGGPLAGDALARQLVNQVVGTLSAGASAASAGVEGTRDGKIAFDRTKFVTALKSDPQGTRALFGQPPAYSHGATATTGAVTVLGSDATAAPGTYGVVVTQAARKASAATTATPLPGDVYQLKRGTGVAEYTVQLGDDLAVVAEKLNAAAAAQKLNITVSATATEIKAESDSYGTGGNFEMTLGGVPVAGTAGLDVAGSIGGVTATGSGQTLSAPVAPSGPSGVSLLVTLSAADVQALAGGPVGSVTVTQGLGDRLTAVAAAATDRTTGQITSAIDTRRSSIKSLDSQIAEWDNRLAMRRKALERQFAGLEKALGTMRSQSNWLSAQIAGMSY